MMKIFDQFLHLTPFAEYLEFIFTKRRMLVVARRSGAKVMHMQLAWSELFKPMNETNIDTTTRVVELGTVAMTTLLREFHIRRRQVISISQYPNLNFRGSTAPSISNRRGGKEATY
jgi:hypothetical protein